MVLKGTRILLRKFKMSDLEEYFDVANDEIIHKYLPFAVPDDLDDCADLIDNYSKLDFINDFYFVIEDIESGKIIGALLCFRTLSSDLDTSYFISKNFRNKNFCLEALTVFIDYLANNTNYKALMFCIDNTNEASKCIMTKLHSDIFQRSEDFIIYKYQLKSAK